jgi:hypothetical protein
MRPSATVVLIAVTMLSSAGCGIQTGKQRESEAAALKQKLEAAQQAATRQAEAPKPKAAQEQEPQAKVEPTKPAAEPLPPVDLPKPIKLKKAEENKPEPPKPAPPKEDRTIVASVNAPSLWMEYLDNAIAADAKYRGKCVQITGNVREVRKDAKGQYYLGFSCVSPGGATRASLARMDEKQRRWFNEGYPPNVVCYITPGHEGAFATVKQDHRIVVVGRPADTRQEDVYMGTVLVVEDCRLTEKDKRVADAEAKKESEAARLAAERRAVQERQQREAAAKEKAAELAEAERAKDPRRDYDGTQLGPDDRSHYLELFGKPDVSKQTISDKANVPAWLIQYNKERVRLQFKLAPPFDIKAENAQWNLWTVSDPVVSRPITTEEATRRMLDRAAYRIPR